MREKNELKAYIAKIVTENLEEVTKLKDENEMLKSINNNDRKKRTQYLNDKNEMFKKYNEARDKLFKLYQNYLVPGTGDKEDLIGDILELHEEMELQ